MGGYDSSGLPAGWHKVKEAALNDSSFSDLTIKCGDSEHHVHRLIFCPQSDFFEKACTGNFKEPQARVIDLPDDDPMAVKSLIEFMYNGDYTDVKLPEESVVDIAADDAELQALEQKKMRKKGKLMTSMDRERYAILKESISQRTEACAPDNQLLVEGSNNCTHLKSQPIADSLAFHVKVYALGEKYNIDLLKARSLETLKSSLSRAPNRVLSVGFREAARLAYRTTPSHDTDMCEALVAAVGNFRAVMDTDSFQDLMLELPEMCLSLARMFAEKIQVGSLHPYENFPGRSHFGRLS